MAGDPQTGGLARPIHADLRQRIVDMDLPPGTTLSPRELAERYGVSQSPVRDALLALHHEGFVQVRPQSRTVVAPIRLGRLAEVHFLRLAVETEVTRKLLLDCPEEVLARARRAIFAQEAAAGQAEAFRDCGDRFHAALFDAAGCVGLHAMLREKAGHIDRAAGLEPEDPAAERVLEAHDAILSAIARRDEEAAVAAMRGHLNPVVGRIDDLRRRHPACFAP